MPLLVTLAWRNLWRHVRRTLLIVFALALGVWSMVTLAALTRGSMEQQLTSAFANLIGHVQIHLPGYRDDPVIDHRFAEPTGALRDALAAPDIIAWAARVRVPAMVSSEQESAGVTLVGIDPAREHDLSFLAKAVKEGRMLMDGNDPGIVLGRKLVERLETALGRRVVILSQDSANKIADRGFRVVGIFDSEPQMIETAYVFIGLAQAQQLLRMPGAVSEIGLITPDRNRLDAVLDRLRVAAPQLDVQPWTQIEPTLKLTESVTDVILMIWYVIVFVAMSFGLVNTLLMAVFERTREFGLFQALGMPPSQILGQVLVESLFLLAVGLALGNLLALATLAATADGIDLSAFAKGFEMIGVSPMLYPMLKLDDALSANLLVFVLGLAASLYPAWRAARYVPVEAITRT